MNLEVMRAWMDGPAGYRTDVTRSPKHPQRREKEWRERRREEGRQTGTWKGK